MLFRSFHCGLELEVADSLLGTVDLARHIDHLYRLVNEAVDVQIQRNRQGVNGYPAPQHRQGNGTVTGKTPLEQALEGAAQVRTLPPVSPKQVKFINELAFNKLNLSLAELEAVCRSVGSRSYASITRDEASQVIEQLRTRAGMAKPTK